MSSYGQDVEREVSWPQTFAVYAKAVKCGGAAERYANQLAAYYADLADYLADGRAALVINHGGIIELGVVASFPDGDYESWGGEADYCEGARLYWEAGKCVNVELLRVSK
jgi:hypothetical protein